MGCLEVANKGYGFTYRYNFDKFKEYNWSEVLPADLSEYQIPDGLEDWQKACYVGATAGYVCGGESCDIDFDSIDDYEIDQCLLAALGVCFEKMYGLPKDSIRSLEDYNGDVMFFLCVTWPPKEYNEVLATLTQDSFLKNINDFISKLCSDGEMKNFYNALEMCEEYIKW